MGFVVEITDGRNWIQRFFHKLFRCSTFWKIKPAFKCPECKATYRCYWDGNDIPGRGIDICNKCVRLSPEELKKREFIKNDRGEKKMFGKRQKKILSYLENV